MSFQEEKERTDERFSKQLEMWSSLPRSNKKYKTIVESYATYSAELQISGAGLINELLPEYKLWEQTVGSHWCSQLTTTNRIRNTKI